MKVDFITIHLDNTVTVKRKKVSGDKVIVKKGKWEPKLTAGKSVFPEAKKPGILGALKRRKRYALAVENSPRCFELDPKAGKLDDHWNTTEAKKFISKAIGLSAISQKPFSTLQTIAIFGALIAVIFLQVLILRG